MLSGLDASAQNPLTLEECIRLALERNITLARQTVQVDMAKDNYQTYRAAVLPEISGFYAHNLSSGKTVNYEDYTYINTQYQDGNMGLQGSVPVFTGLSNWFQRKSGHSAFLSETERKKELIRTVSLDVTAAYLKILLTEELLGVAQAKLTATKEQLRMNEGLFDNGRMAKVEVLNMKAQVAQDNLAKIQAENDVKTAYLTLAQLLNTEEEIKIEKPKNLDASVELAISSPASITDHALIQHPGITSADYLVKARESQLSAMRARLSPSVSINGIVYTRYSELGVNQLNPSAPYPYSDQLKDNMYGRASVNVNIPIFSQFQIRSRINQANLQARDAKLALDQKKLSVRNEIHLAYTAALNAQAKHEASLEAVVSANESFSLTQEKYSAGLSSAVDFKISQSQLAQAQLAQIQAKYEFIILSKILDLYLDKPISLQ
jgi:outer membrane protein